MKSIKFLLLIPVSLFLTVSFISLKVPKENEIVKMLNMRQDTIKWVAPNSANDLINPYELTDENIAEGLLLYKKLCRSCHGRNGDGQGVEAEDLETITTDFTKSLFLEQTDGSMFWKISEGKDDMESFKKRLDEEEIWLVILYIKSFSEISEK